MIIMRSKPRRLRSSDVEMTAAPDGAFRQVVEELADKIDRPVEVLVVPDFIGIARSHEGDDTSARIEVGAGVLQQPADIQRFLAAHEVGHLKIPAPRSLRLAITTTITITLAAALARACEQIAPIFGFQVAPVVTTTTTVVFAAGMALFVASLAADAAGQRRLERQVDQLAATWGYPLTTAGAEWLAGNETRFARSWLGRPLRRHPLAADRIPRGEKLP